MRPLRVSDHIVPVSVFKAQTAEWLRRVAESGHPLVITQNGKAAGVLLSPAQYDELTERQRYLEAIRKGLADIEAGRVHDHETVLRAIRERFGRSRDE
jgi:prevent-host-death family protein